LLDLPVDADPADARRALRRLARRVHPDALGPSAPSALRRASSEIMSALIEAERAMRAVEAP
jgi:curved DNA-binding protein CbpA